MNEDALGLHVSDVQTRRADPRDAVGHMNGDQPGHGAHRRVRACAVRCASAWKPWWKLEGLLSSMRSRTMSGVWGWRAGRALSTQGGLAATRVTGMPDADGRRAMGSAAPGPARGSGVWGERCPVSARAKCGNGKYGVLEQTYKRTRRHGAHTTRRISAVTPESGCAIRSPLSAGGSEVIP